MGFVGLLKSLDSCLSSVLEACVIIGSTLPLPDFLLPLLLELRLKMLELFCLSCLLTSPVYSFILSLCIAFWIISSYLFSNSLILSLTLSDFPFNLFIEFLFIYLFKFLEVLFVFFFRSSRSLLIVFYSLKILSSLCLMSFNIVSIAGFFLI